MNVPGPLAGHASPGLRERALGAFLGLACGDALGATVEFMTAREIRAQYGTHRELTGGGWLRLQPGQVTDDTQMSLALGEALISSGGWNLKAIAEAFAAWLKTRPPDIGNTCRRGIRRYMLDGSLAAPPSEADAGNGAAMRLLPAVLLALHDPQSLERHVIEQAHLTHHHPLSDAACLTLAQMLHVLLHGGGVKATRPAVHALLANHRQFRFDPWPGRATAYIVDTLQTVLHHFYRTDSVESCIVECVNSGDDADTTGAIAGMLAGALHGASSIPERWLRRLDPAVYAAIVRQTDRLLQLAARDSGPDPAARG